MFWLLLLLIFVVLFYFILIGLKEHIETKPIKSIVADICDTEAVGEAFENVDVVFHCAAFINFQFPPNINELERINVDGKSMAVYSLQLVTAVCQSNFNTNETMMRLCMDEQKNKIQKTKKKRKIKFPTMIK